MPKARTRRTKKTNKQTVSKPTIWQALNEPVVEVTPDFARAVFLAAAIIIMMAWVLPYWGSAQVLAAEYPVQPVFQVAQVAVVAGDSTTAAPDWYYLMQRIANDVTFEFGQAAYSILDISDPIQESLDFYAPGVEAVWNAWLELMADPIYY